MAKPFIALDKPGAKGLVLGNEAIARGALEAGVIIGSGYPGTPSSEILSNFAELSTILPEMGLKVEWSINEKVGFEVAYGGSLCNARSLATMKHVGVNVASDSFMTACYSGALGGMVLITADDPTLHSSQNEQDNRFYGMQALIPTFEPSNVQESKDMLKYAFEFSEKYQTIVLYRTTTRLNHARGDLTLGELKKLDRVYKFDELNAKRWVNSPKNARENKKELLTRLEKVAEVAEEFPFNEISKPDGVKVGIISSGIPFAHVKDALELLGLQKKVALFKLGIVFPLPKKKLAEFMKGLDKLIVVEELEPIFEQELRALAFDEKIKIEIHGKDLFPQAFELYPELIVNRFSTFFSIKSPIEYVELEKILPAPPRPPVLCAGCGHRNIYTANKRVERRLKTRLIHSSDIGCYTLGFYEPLNAIDTCIAMGASIGLANGYAKLDQRASLAFLGDSTFYHSGLSGLVNAILNDNDIIVVIMDNGSTSMTGHQDHPGTGVRIDKSEGVRIDFIKFLTGLGLPRDQIWVPDSNNLDEMEFSFEQAIKTKGVRVIIPTSMCSLLKVEDSKKKKTPIPKVEVNIVKCCAGEYCLRTLGCPAMSIEGDVIKIDETSCSGCTMCTQFCPYYALKVQIIPEKAKNN
jgi:indolepyruvate ferredoxin oxidoreductase alpha subunit